MLFVCRCSNFLRFQKDDLDRLRVALHLPMVMRAPNRTVWSGLEGLCLVLYRLSYPSRLFDVEHLFFRGQSEASVIFNSTLDFLYQEWMHVLDDIQHARQTWLSDARVEEGCQAIHESCPLDMVWGFIDGTCIPISRPTRHQRLWYSGHKRRHVMKFQVCLCEFWFCPKCEFVKKPC